MCCKNEYAPVAQLDRALDSDSKGRWFESSRAYQIRQKLRITYVIRSFCFFNIRVQGGNLSKCAEQAQKISYIPMFYLPTEMMTWEFCF